MVMERWRPSAMMPWKPFRAMEEMERYMDEMLGGLPFRTWRRLPLEEISWSPPVEMYEKDDKLVVRTELPGVKMEDIDISMTGDTLTIKGERRASREVKDEDYHRCEVCYGSFSRSVTMPASADVSKIQAVYDDGILEVTVPKSKVAKPARIAIKAKGAEKPKIEAKAKSQAKAKSAAKPKKA